MAHGAREHGFGQVEAPPSVGDQRGVEGEDLPLLGEPDLPRGVEAVAFAGHRDVAGAIEAQPHGPLRQRRTEGGECRIAVGLHLLAAEAAAHAQALHGHLVGGHTEDVGDDVLRLGRVLGRGLDEDLVVLVDVGQAGLCLEVEVFLSGEVEFAFEDVCGIGEGRIDLALVDEQWLPVVAVGGNGVADGDERRQRLDLGNHGCRAFFRCFEVFGEHPGQGLAEEHDLLSRQHRLVVFDALVVDAGDVGGGDDAHDSGHRVGGFDVEGAASARVRSSTARGRRGGLR
jgi:hypothetical protein